MSSHQLKTYEDILQSKIDYYGETKAAYHFAAEELANIRAAEAVEEYKKKLKLKEEDNYQCGLDGGKDKCVYASKDYFSCVLLRKCEKAIIKQ